MPMRTVTVPTTVVQIAAFDGRRRSLNVFNNGANTVFLSQDQAAVTGNGHPVLASASATFLRRDGDEPELALFAQALVGSNDVRVTEGFGLVE